MQATSLKVGFTSLVRSGTCKNRPLATLQVLSANLQRASGAGINHAARSYTARAAKNPVHATPQYMEYDTLVDMHLVTRQSFGNRPLFGSKRGSGPNTAFEWLTYKDFGKQVDRCRAALAAQGIGRGDAVAIISGNREEWAICAYATYSIGGIFVPMYEEQVSFGITNSNWVRRAECMGYTSEVSSFSDDPRHPLRIPPKLRTNPSFARPRLYMSIIAGAPSLLLRFVVRYKPSLVRSIDGTFDRFRMTPSS